MIVEISIPFLGEFGDLRKNLIKVEYTKKPPSKEKIIEALAITPNAHAEKCINVLENLKTWIEDDWLNDIDLPVMLPNNKYYNLSFRFVKSVQFSEFAV